MREKTIEKIKEYVSKHKYYIDISRDELDSIQNSLIKRAVEFNSHNVFEYEHFTDVNEFLDNFYSYYDEYINTEVIEWYVSEIHELLQNPKSELYDDTFSVNDEEQCESVYFAILDSFEVEYPEDDILNAKIDVNILTHFYNEFDDCIKWLMHSQGYKLSDNPAIQEALGKTYRSNDLSLLERNKEEIKSSIFRKSLLQEVEETYRGYSNIFTVLVKMSIKDYFELVSGKKAIQISKNCTCGIFEPYEGGGSLLNIALEKPIKIEPKNIYRIQIENKKHFEYFYTVNEVYGLMKSAWKDEYNILPAKRKANDTIKVR